MQEIIDFLRQLRDNNNRMWFQANKDRYLRCAALFDDITQQIITGIESFDPSVKGLQPKDCTYRIYRDVRFSSDKSPYKTHMGCYVCPGGKKSGYVGYYFHIGVGDMGTEYPFGHMVAVGDYCYEPKVLQTLREDIVNGDGDFHDIVTKQCSPLFALDKTGALKRNPKGFEPDAPWAEYLRLKTFCLFYTPDNSFLTAPDAIAKVVELFRSALPFTQYINRAIEFTHGEK